MVLMETYWRLDLIRVSCLYNGRRELVFCVVLSHSLFWCNWDNRINSHFTGLNIIDLLFYIDSGKGFWANALSWYCQKWQHENTRKSSCATARGVTPAAYPVRCVCCLMREGGGGGGIPDLGSHWDTPSIPYPGKDLVPETGYLPPPQERTWDQRLGYPLPQERTRDQRLRYPLASGKGPGTRDYEPVTSVSPSPR